MPTTLRTILLALGVLALFGAGPAQAQLFSADPLIEAAQVGDADSVNALLVRGTNPNVRDRKGRTALMHAAIGGYERVVARLLVGTGAFLDLVDDQGNTALLYAASQGHTGVALILIDAGAKKEMENRAGETALMRAVRGGHAQTVRALLEAQVSIDRADFTGRTALDYAREGRMAQIERLLIAAGGKG